MSPRLKRALRWTLGTIGVLLVLVIGALYFLLSGEGAARRLIGFALEGNEGTVSISRVNGRLRSPLMLAGISFNLPKLRGTIDSMYIDWDLGALLGRRLSVNQLHAIGVRITVPDSTAPTPVDTVPPARLHLPVDVILGDVRIDSLSLQAPGNLALHEATARLTGRAEDFHLTASGTLTTPALDHSVPVALTARGDLDHIEMTPLSADLFGGRVNATGTVGWFPKIGWKLTVVADRLRPGLLLKDSTSLPGTASIFARTIGELDSIGPVGTVLVDSMNGALRRQPISGNANVHLAGPAYDISTLRMGWGSATLTTSGRVADTLALDYLLDVSTLSTLMPGASGTLEVKGRLTGPRQAGRTSATVSGRRLAYGTSRLARLDGRLALDLAPQGRDDLRVDGEHAAVGGKVIDRITLSLLGTRAQHRITLEGGAAFGSMDIVLTGGLAPDSGVVEWRGQVTTLALHNASAGEWTLKRPAALVASADSVSLGMLCIAPNDSARAATMATSASTDTTRGGLCAEGGAVMGVGWRVKGEVDQLPLALADSLLPGGRTMTGTVGGTFEAGVTGTRLTAEARLGLDRAALLYKSVRDTTPQRLALDTATLVLHAGSDGVRAVVRMQLAGTDSSAIGHLNADLTLPEYTTLGAPLGTQHFSTKVEARIDNLAFVRTLDAGVDSINGKLALDVSGDGTVRAPHLNGSMELTDFNAWMPNSRAAHGAVSATLASTVAQDRRVTAEFRIVPRAVFYDYTLGLLPRRIVVDSGGIEIKVGTDGVQGALALGLSDTSKTRLASVFGDVRMPKYVSLDFPLREQPITLKLDGDIPNLGFARAFMPGMDSLSGRLRLGMGVEGTLGTPAITGTLRLSELIARLAQGSLLTGNIDGDLKATVARDSTFSLDLRVVPRDFVLSPVTSKSRQRFTLGGSALDVQSHGQGVVGTLNFEVADTTGKSVASIAGKASLPELRKLGAPVDSGPIAAQLHGSIADLAFVEALVASVDSIAGQVRFDATADGTVGHPRVAGGLEIDNTAVRLPIAGVLYHDIKVRAVGDQSGRLTLSGQARSGAGQLTLEGKSPVRPTKDEPGHLQIRGQNFEAINTTEVHAIVSPDLSIDLTSDSINVTGEVGIPSAAIHLTDVPNAAIPPPDEIVFTDTLGLDSAKAGYKIAAEVRVVLGDSVVFQGFNFTAKLGGSLLAHESPARPTTGSGTIVIEHGQYKAYGQDLTITDGTVRFAGGPVDNPGLNLRASRTAAEDSVVAGLDIKGTLKAPEVTIFSEPSMSQDRALEYIVLGHPRETSGSSSGSLMSKAASALGLRGGNLLAKSVGRGLGLEDARIETTGNLQQASFVAGKYLSPNLYVSYGIGLFDPISTLRLRYVLSSRWTLQAERGGAASGADLLYRFEVGKPTKKGAGVAERK